VGKESFDLATCLKCHPWVRTNFSERRAKVNMFWFRPGNVLCMPPTREVIESHLDLGDRPLPMPSLIYRLARHLYRPANVCKVHLSLQLVNLPWSRGTSVGGFTHFKLPFNGGWCLKLLLFLFIHQLKFHYYLCKSKIPQQLHGNVACEILSAG